MQWVDERNYTEVIKPWFRKNSAFPFNFFVPGVRHRRFCTRINHTVGEHIRDSTQLENKVRYTYTKLYMYFFLNNR